MLPLARELAPHFRALAPDLPGFGHSDHPPAALDVPELADALLAWIDAAGLTALRWSPTRWVARWPSPRCGAHRKRSGGRY
jgi:pimeloyl-ACP methyl ester carboxylesterase